jgi:phosphatidate cytidylyltransferase
VVLLAVFLAALFFLPAEGMAVLMAAVAALGGYEWALLCGLTRALARVYAAGVVLVMAALFFLQLAVPALAAACAFWILVVPAWLALGVKAAHRALLLAAGFIVLVPAALAMVVLDPRTALLVLGVAWIGDTAAYYVGRRWGRHKLAPAISPGKTWEGALGGLIGGAAYAMIVALFLAGVQATGMAVFIGAAALLVALSIVGDLFESAAKRQAGVKDSGTLLPGHGGVLDRIDSATAVLPVAAMLVAFAR